MFSGHTERYARSAALPQIRRYGQQKLANSRVTIIGCGGLGTVSAELLARAGVGHLRLVDDDHVELANLAGQTLFDEEDARLGRLKVLAAAHKLHCLNPTITIEPVPARINARNAYGFIAGADLVLDGTDNDAARYLINKACLRQSIPWIFAAVLESYGLTMNIVPGKTACFECVFGHPGCDRGGDHSKGYLAAATHLVASLQVSQALRLLLEDDGYSRGLVYVDVWAPELERLDVKMPLEGCPACRRRSGDKKARSGLICSSPINLQNLA
jgi:adenylyltransferase/sulfurtransferase